MSEFRSGVESVVSDEVGVKLGRRLATARTSRIGEVDAVQSKVFRVTHHPLEVVHQRPGRVAAYIAAVKPDRCALTNTMKKALRETQTLRAGCSKTEPKIFAPPRTPFPGARDGQNLISWRWSQPLHKNPVW